MKKLLTLLFALICSIGLWAQNNVITYTASEKLPEVTEDNDAGLHINNFAILMIAHEFDVNTQTGTITFEKNIPNIPDITFRGCSNLTSITFPSGVKGIGSEAFNGCSNLTSITFPSSVEDIGADAFRDCSNLTSITLPSSVKGIGNDAFNGCSNLTSITLPSTIESIAGDAFYGIGAVVVTIACADNDAFANYLKRTGENPFFCLQDLDDDFYRITVAGEELTAVEIPSGVTSIFKNAFRRCKNITSVTIPSSVESIGDGAFSICDNLGEVTCFCTTPPSLGYESFDDVTLDKIIVPAGKAEAYKTASGWSEYADKIEEMPPVATVTIGSDTKRYPDLAEAWDAATAQSGTATVQLHEDVTLSATLQISTTTNPTIILDLNDHVLTGTAENNIISTSQSNTLTITDNSTTKTKRYFTVSNGTCTWSDTETSDYVEGGVMTGTGRAVYYGKGTLLTVRNVNFVGNGTSSNLGGAIDTESPTNIYNCTFYGNKGGDGGAVYGSKNILIKDSKFKYNSALQNGGAIYSAGVVTLINDLITDNSVTTSNGGGVCLGEAACLAAGTMITMADGTTKRIEEIKIGDAVQTFDHEKGVLSESPILYVFKSTVQSRSFTLTFKSGTTLDFVRSHSILCQETLKYECLTAQTAASYIGQHFYNATSRQWDELVGIQVNDTPTDYYSPLTAPHINCVANGMLTVLPECSFFLNMYELDSTLKVNADQLAADIAKYGFDDISNYPQYAQYSELFDLFNGKYLKIISGKGLESIDHIWRLFDMLVSATHADGASPSSNRSRALKAPTTQESEPDYSTYSDGASAPCLIVGKNVVIKDNKVLGVVNNVYLSNASNGYADATIRLIADHSGSEIGVKTASDPRVITSGTGVTASDVSIFKSDDQKDVIFADNQIAILTTPGVLCFKAQEAGSTVQLNKAGTPTEITFETSTSGVSWSEYTFTEGTGATITLANVGDKVYFRNKADEAAKAFDGDAVANDVYSFSMSGKIAASGNVMSLMDKSCNATVLPDYALNCLFFNCESLTSAPELPAKSLGKCCYKFMFYGCKNLTVAPVLPATNLADYCYEGMFNGCSNLATIPTLPATPLAINCYKDMFSNCSSLKMNTEAPGYEWAVISEAADYWNLSMFSATGGTFTGSPKIGTIYYLASTPGVKLNSAGYATYSTYFNAHIDTEGVKAYKAEVNGTDIVLTELDDDIPAGTGVLLYGEDMAGTVVTFSPSTTEATNAEGTALNPTTMIPCEIEDKPADKYIFALGGGELFLHYTGKAFAHNRAYFALDTDPTADSGAKTMRIVFADEEANGIKAVNSEQLTVNNGKRIENGKLVIVKDGKKFTAQGVRVE